MLPYFIKSENNTGANIEAGFHGTDGPLSVMDRVHNHQLSDAFVDATGATGLPQNSDFNGKTQEGFGRYQVTQKNSKRSSASTAYLHPVLKRSNLTVETNAHVLQLKITADRVTSVEYMQNGKVRLAESAGEVILSAGAIGSPQIMMLSGFGPAAELGRHGIAVRADMSGVGQNLYDHLNLSVLAKTKEPISMARIGGGVSAISALVQYMRNRTGLGTINGAESGGFVASHLNDGRPDIQMYFVSLMLGAGMIDQNPRGDGTCLQPVAHRCWHRLLTTGF